MSDRHICDCGNNYTTAGELMSCAGGNHGRGWGDLDPTAEQYEHWVQRSWGGSTVVVGQPGKLIMRDLFVMCVGLAGEVGEVLEPIKKHIRSGRALNRDEMVSELGDVLYYLTMIAQWQGVTLGEIMAENQRKVNDRIQRGKLPSGEFK